MGKKKETYLISADLRNDIIIKYPLLLAAHQLQDLGGANQTLCFTIL
jgi:hypothetical protein